MIPLMLPKVVFSPVMNNTVLQHNLVIPFRSTIGPGFQRIHRNSITIRDKLCSKVQIPFQI